MATTNEAAALENEGLLNTLSAQEATTLGEIGNIAMGAGMTSLAAILGTTVEFASPEVQSHEALASWPEPFGSDPKTVISVPYTEGMAVGQALIFKNEDVQRLSLWMMGDLNATPMADADPSALSDLDISALGEAISQMSTAAANSLASVLGNTVEAANPEITPYTPEALQTALSSAATPETPLASLLYTLNIGNGKTLSMLQVFTLPDARKQIEIISSQQTFSVPSDEAEASSSATASSSSSPKATAASAGVSEPVTVQPVQFASFDNQPSTYAGTPKNLELVLDVMLNLTVELGRTEISIKEVLELTRGSVIELDRIAGEPVDLMANGKLIAKGEVVVIEDNFGLRITSIVAPADRLRGLQAQP